MILKVIDKYVQHQGTERLKICKSPSYLFQILCVIENLHASSTFRLVLSVDRVRFPLDWHCGFISCYSILLKQTSTSSTFSKSFTWVRSSGAKDKNKNKQKVHWNGSGRVGWRKKSKKTNTQTSTRKSKKQHLYMGEVWRGWLADAGIPFVCADRHHLLCCNSQTFYNSLSHKGSHPLRKVQFFLTLFKRPLTPPLSFEHLSYFAGGVF